MTSNADSPRLCLIVEVAPDPKLLTRTEAALTASGAVTLVLAAPAGGSLEAAALKPLVAPLVAMAQKLNVAALIENDASLARAVGADGVHLAARSDIVDAYETARNLLGPNAIIGADAGGSRHDAMELGESGADYVAFSIDTAEHEDLVAWWVELFTIPVVALGVDREEDAASLAAIGTDFIAARLPLGVHEQDVAAWAAGLARAVRNPGNTVA
ncbi:MAG: thiamine phosphate synthase [Hyphomicrobium sp.]|jgi:thiamine-phosphate pyrophosphorylase